MADPVVIVPVTEVKPSWQSKTLWTNIVMALAAMFVPQVQDVISQNPEYTTVAWSIINCVLRFITKDKVVLK